MKYAGPEWMAETNERSSNTNAYYDRYATIGRISMYVGWAKGIHHMGKMSTYMYYVGGIYGDNRRYFI